MRKEDIVRALDLSYDGYLSFLHTIRNNEIFHINGDTEYLKKLVRAVLAELNEAEVLEYSNREPEEIVKCADEIVNRALNRYNEEHTPVQYFSVSFTDFGIMFNFVRDDELEMHSEFDIETGLENERPVLAWVENVDNPDLSELGYIVYDCREYPSHQFYRKY